MYESECSSTLVFFITYQRSYLAEHYLDVLETTTKNPLHSTPGFLPSIIERFFVLLFQYGVDGWWVGERGQKRQWKTFFYYFKFNGGLRSTRTEQKTITWYSARKKEAR